MGPLLPQVAARRRTNQQRASTECDERDRRDESPALHRTRLLAVEAHQPAVPGGLADTTTPPARRSFIVARNSVS